MHPSPIQTHNVLGALGKHEKWPLLSIQGRRGQASEEQQSQGHKMQDSCWTRSLEAQAGRAMEESVLWVGGERTSSCRTSFPFPSPPHPTSSAPVPPVSERGVTPSLLSGVSFHTGHLNWGRKLNGFNAHFPSKGPRSFHGQHRGWGGAALEKLPLVEPRRRAKLSNYNPLSSWKTLWAEVTLMVGDQNHPLFFKMTLRSPVLPISVHYNINSLFGVKKMALF